MPVKKRSIKKSLLSVTLVIGFSLVFLTLKLLKTQQRWDPSTNRINRAAANLSNLVISWRHQIDLGNINYLFPWMPQNQIPLEKGIIITVHEKVLALTLTNIQSIRQTSDLPIYLFYISETIDFKTNGSLSRFRHKTNSYRDIKFMDLSLLLPDDVFRALEPVEFSVKPFALLLAPCQECILLDSDAFTLLPINSYFQLQGYRETGTMFFQDRLIGFAGSDVSRDGLNWFYSFYSSEIETLNQGNPYIQRFLRESEFISGRSPHQQESGLIVLDKGRSLRHLAGLAISVALNHHPFRQETWLNVHGDKETFWIGMMISGAPFVFNKYRAGNLGIRSPLNVSKSGGGSPGSFRFYLETILSGVGLWEVVCGGTMAHTLHETWYSGPTLAWFNGGLLYNKYSKTGSGHELANFDSWLISDGWDLETEDYCARSVAGGALYPFLGTLGSSISRVSKVETLILESLLKSFDKYSKEFPY